MEYLPTELGEPVFQAHEPVKDIPHLIYICSLYVDALTFELKGQSMCEGTMPSQVYAAVIYYMSATHALSVRHQEGHGPSLCSWYLQP